MAPDEDEQVEQLLQKYEIAGPPDSLRRRVLAKGWHPQADSFPLGGVIHWRTWISRAAVAAALVAAVWLNVAAGENLAQVRASIGPDPAEISRRADALASLIDGDGWAHAYALRMLGGKETSTKTQGDVR